MSVNQDLIAEITRLIRNPRDLEPLLLETTYEQNPTPYLTHMLKTAARAGHTASYKLAAREYFRRSLPDANLGALAAMHEATAHGHEWIAQDLFARCFEGVGDRGEMLHGLLWTALGRGKDIPHARWILATGGEFELTRILPTALRRAFLVGDRELVRLMLEPVRAVVEEARRAADGPGRLRDLRAMMQGVLERPSADREPLDLIRGLRSLFEHPSFARNIPASEKFARFSRQDCLDVVYALGSELPWLLVQGLSEHLRQQAPYDLYLTLDSKVFPMHRDVISMWSPVLRARVNGEWKGRTNVTCDTNIEQKVIQEVLDCMYTGRFVHMKQTKDELRDIADVARVFGIAGLEKQVEKLY
ncbi:hypothetical protein BJY00DRAFT_279066 [Aspergillus carlsbadensis]|nr:hypothetical protein BJY00DRAFT_279066 [Aspergillus carlsbadensis]